MSRTLITSRDPQGLHAIDLFATTYNESRLDDIRAQQLNERGAELRDGIAKLIAELSISNRYADEEVSSSHTYPEGYKGPKPIVDQIMTLAALFNLDPTQALEYTKNLPPLPKEAEGWFAVPSVDAIAAQHFPEVTDPVDKYCWAVRLVHTEIMKSRPFYSSRNSQITPTQLRVHAHTAHALDLIAKNQLGNPSTGSGSSILIIAAQLGLRHRSRSVRRSREVFMANEFGLTSLIVGSIVLVHPERLVSWGELDMDCPGDEFDNPNDDDRFSRAPFFLLDGGRIKFVTRRVSSVYSRFGSASGFVSQ